MMFSEVTTCLMALVCLLGDNVVAKVDTKGVSRVLMCEGFLKCVLKELLNILTLFVKLSKPNIAIYFCKINIEHYLY